MFKDIFTLKKTSWHAKYMYWIWNFYPEEFRNMCPYFWLSVFNVVFSPIIIPIKLVFFGILWFVTMFEERTARIRAREEVRIAAIVDRIVNGTATEDDLKYSSLLLFRSGRGDDKCFNSYVLRDTLADHLPVRDAKGSYVYSLRKRLALAIERKTNPMFDRLEAMMVQLEEQWTAKEDAAREEAARRYREKLERKSKKSKSTWSPATVLPYVKVIGQLGAIAIAAFAGYWIVIGIGWVIDHATIDHLKTAGFAILVLAGICIVVVVVIAVIEKLKDWVTTTDCLPDIDCKFCRFIGKILSTIGEVCIGIGNGIVSTAMGMVKVSKLIWVGFIGFFKLLYQLYKNSCPGIEWND